MTGRLPITGGTEESLETASLAARSGGAADWIGIVASIGCAIHCAAMPFVIAFLPALGLSFLADAVFHKVMVFVCSALAIASFVPGFRRHGRKLPMGIATVGIGLISLAAFVVECECCPACAADVEVTELSIDPPTLEVGTLVSEVNDGSCTDDCCQDGCCETDDADRETLAMDSGVAGELVSFENSDPFEDSDPLEDSGDDEVCTDPNCSACAGDVTAADGELVSPSKASVGFPFAAWMTPIGGLVLVSAHLTNRRFNCRCGCCPSKEG